MRPVFFYHKKVGIKTTYIKIKLSLKATCKQKAKKPHLPSQRTEGSYSNIVDGTNSDSASATICSERRGTEKQKQKNSAYRRNIAIKNI